MVDDTAGADADSAVVAAVESVIVDPVAEDTEDSAVGGSVKRSIVLDETDGEAVGLGIGTAVDFTAVNSDVEDSAVDIGVDTSAADTAVDNPAMDSDVVGPVVENSFVDISIAESVMEKSVADLVADDSVAATVVDISLVFPVGDDPIVDPVTGDSVDGNSVAVRFWQRVPENPSGQRQPTSPVLGTRKQVAPF